MNARFTESRTLRLVDERSDPRLALSVSRRRVRTIGAATASRNPASNVEGLETRRLLAGNPGLQYVVRPPLENMPAAGVSHAYADLNKDGKIDLIRTTSVGPNSLAVQYGQGNGNFAAPTSFAGPTNIMDIEARDVNQDGNVDVVFVAGTDKTLQVSLGNGTGGLTPSSNISLGNLSPLEFTMADFDRDGHLDVAVTGFQDNFVPKGIVKTFLSNGNGTFRAGQSFIPSVATDFTAPQGVAAGDFNGDNWQDFVVLHQSTQQGYQVYLNNQNGTFTQQSIVVTPADVPARVATGDFNLDGRSDFAFTAQSSTYGSSFPAHDLGVAISNGTGGFNVSYYAIATDQDYILNQLANPLVADLDGDGLLDLAACGGTNSGAGVIGILRGMGNGSFVNTRTISNPPQASNLVAVDVTSDGVLDIMATRGGNSSVNRIFGSTTTIVWAMDPSGPYSGASPAPYAFTQTLDNVELPISYTWYQASDPNTPIAPPVDAGNYIIRATAAGDANHPAATSTFAYQITQGSPSFSFQVPPVSPYNALPVAATANVLSASGATIGSATIAYYLPSDVSFSNPLPSAPVNAGTYVARATFGGSNNLLAGSATTSFRIDPTSPTVNVSATRWTPYTGSPVAIQSSVTGVNGENLGPATLKYFRTSDPGLTSPLPQVPVDIGGYFVMAEYPGSGNYYYFNAVAVFFIVAPESLTVTSTNDHDDGNASPFFGGGTSLREAIRYAAQHPGPDTITFAPELAGQTITLQNGWTNAADDTAIRVLSDVTIDGGGATINYTGPAGRRHFASFSGNTFTLRNLTLSGGNLTGVNDGGALWTSGSVVIDNVRFLNNAANNGGAICVQSTGQVSILNSRFESNSGANLGGAINSDGNVSVTGSVFTSNLGGQGGAIQSTGSLTVSTSTFNGNQSNFNGGALRLFGTATIDRSTFDGNTVVNEGGAFISFGNTAVSNSTFANNGRNAVLLWEGNATLDHVTVAYNTNGGLLSASAQTTLRNSIVAGNVGFDQSGTLAGGSSNNLLNVSATTARLGTLGQNGGTTATIELLPGSPAINAGVAISGINVDQRGIVRPQGSTPDLGAYERVATPAVLTSASLDYLTRLAVQFTFDADASVAFDRSAITLTNVDTNQVVNVGSLSWSSDGRTASLILTNLLADGNYRVQSGATTFDFFVLGGDFNRDRTVNFDDLLVLAQQYGSAGNNSQGDANYDGQVNFDDLLALAQNYDRTLAPQAATVSKRTTKQRSSGAAIGL